VKNCFISSLDLAYYLFPTKAPNHAMQLTGSARHGSYSPQTPTPLPRRAPPAADLVFVRFRGMAFVSYRRRRKGSLL
jgi:hypothetical protein